MMPDIESRLERIFERAARRRGRLGAPQVALRGPGIEFTSGDQETPFHAASIGKLFTGALVLQLVEAGKLEIDAPLDHLLSPGRLRGLFVDGAPAPTVLHLLRHTSGAADYFEGRRGARLRDAVTADPHRTWTPDELLDFSGDRLRPVGPPGGRFLYSDTGFVLLGRIIEEVAGGAYHEILAERILAPLGLERTFMPGLSAPARGDARIAPCYVGAQDLSRTAALSCGWAGGGIAATPADLLRFSEALHGGELIGAESLALMADMRNRVRAGIRYGTAMMELRFEGFSPLLRGYPRPLGHLGSLGTSLFHTAARRTHLVMNFHSRKEISRAIRSAIAVEAVLR